MTLFHAHQTLKATARLVVLAVIAAPGIAFSQGGLEALADRERQIVEQIEREESQNGPYSGKLIGLLTTLSLFYEEVGDPVLADASIERVLGVTRANYGLYSLEQAPFIRRLIRRAEARGNITAAWNLEQELLGLAERHRDDLQTARILRETADRRMDVLRRYEAGQFPPEIVLGCYYDDDSGYREAWLRASRPIMVAPGGQIQNRCTSGSRRQARQSLLAEAQAYYAESINIILRNELYSSKELRDLLMEIVGSSYRYNNPQLGRRSLNYLLAYQNTNAAPWVTRIETMVQLADWDLLYSRDFGTNLKESALATYEQAHDLLKERGTEQASIDEIFSPETPVVLPSFLPNPLISRQAPESTGYIDVAFVVTRDGKSERIEIVGAAANVTRAAEKDLVNLIKRSRFRPRVTDGRFTDSAPMVVRYHLND